MGLLDARHAAKFVIVASILAACGEPVPEPPRDLLGKVNAYRKEHGCGALEPDKTLQRAAEAHAGEMAALAYFSHFSPKRENRTPYDRLKRLGWREGRRFHEMIAKTDTPDGALLTWTRLGPHREALTDAQMSAYGFSRKGEYWVLILGAR